MGMERLIGRFTGTEKGTLLICFGGMHGNEPAGVQALEKMFQMLEVEPITNPNFNFKGRLLGLRGNLRAMQAGERFIKKDLNRQWTQANVDRIFSAPISQLDEEDLELKENLELIRQEIADYNPEKIVVLDIHTTTAFGGIFGIATDDPESLRIAVELHAPVITGIMKGIKGTSLHYFNKDHFDYDIVPVVFEAGQHDEQVSANRAIAALTNCMRTVGCVNAQDVENKHDEILIEYSKGLPKVASLIMKHTINQGDNFVMAPNYKNFQPVTKDEVLAHDRHGEIRAQQDGLILMPLYQKQGDDGFFLIEKVDY